MLVPIEGVYYALFQCHFWFHVQGLYQFFTAQDGALNVSGAGRIALLPCVPIARSNEWIRSLMLVSVPVDTLIVWYPVRGNACAIADAISPA